MPFTFCPATHFPIAHHIDSRAFFTDSIHVTLQCIPHEFVVFVVVVRIKFVRTIDLLVEEVRGNPKVNDQERVQKLVKELYLEALRQ